MNVQIKHRLYKSNLISEVAVTYGAINPKKPLMKIRFLSKNPHKIAEATKILGPTGVEVIPVNLAIDELQSNDTEWIVRDKALRRSKNWAIRSSLNRPGFFEPSPWLFGRVDPGLLGHRQSGPHVRFLGPARTRA
ncbi:hypothetical protein PY650_26660 [Rhizobium calliandrae]|uniref:Non-canonical purine NTP pyrophosphatase n=1 Tax=Rhizobium calliandrae TaxID=1312182 RepID=A0ABT7KKJ2_9HYPH|nr:hypothetical protein [Rhizobium calliandrae]MDL2409154.1 hypothetical protein [Rhizobium calliandrae]